MSAALSVLSEDFTEDELDVVFPRDLQARFYERGADTLPRMQAVPGSEIRDNFRPGQGAASDKLLLTVTDNKQPRVRVRQVHATVTQEILYKRVPFRVVSEHVRAVNNCVHHRRELR